MVFYPLRNMICLISFGYQIPLMHCRLSNVLQCLLVAVSYISLDHSFCLENLKKMKGGKHSADFLEIFYWERIVQALLIMLL